MSTMDSERPIVVGVDGSPSSEYALDWAVTDARRRSLPLRLVHARGIPFGDPRFLAAYTDPEPGLSGIARAAVERVHSMAPDLEVTAESPRTTPARALLADSHSADCVVLGVRGHRILPAALLGSTSTQVSTHARCPVVVVRGPVREPAATPQVVVGIDGSAASADAVEFAFEEAAAYGALLTALHASWFVVQDGTYSSESASTLRAAVRERERELASASLTRSRERHPEVEVREVVISAHPVEALSSASEGADLVVLGSRGRGGFTGLLLGSVGQGLLHSSRSPVAIVHPRVRGADESHHQARPEAREAPEARASAGPVPTA